MKQFLVTTLKGVISFVSLVAFILISWGLILAILMSFDQSFSNMDKSIVLAIVSAIASIITLVVSKSADRNSALHSEKRKANQPIYEKMIKDIFSSKIDKKAIREEYMPFISVHSSDEVLTQFQIFCDSENTSYDKLLLALRRELKLTNKQISK